MLRCCKMWQPPSLEFLKTTVVHCTHRCPISVPLETCEDNDKLQEPDRWLPMRGEWNKESVCLPVSQKQWYKIRTTPSMRLFAQNVFLGTVFVVQDRELPCLLATSFPKSCFYFWERIGKRQKAAGLTIDSSQPASYLGSCHLQPAPVGKSCPLNMTRSVFWRGLVLSSADGTAQFWNSSLSCHLDYLPTSN